MSTGSELVRPEDISALSVEERGQVITRALEESKSWLTVATQGTDPTPIAQFKAWAATVAEMTRQKGLAEEIQLDALEMVRRADRGIAVSVRNGQQAGEIRSLGDGTTRPRRDYTRNGVTVKAAVVDDDRAQNIVSPGDFFGSGDERVDSYRMADGISDEQFEEALTEARDEGNLTRANVVRKVQGIATGRLSRVQKADKIREMAQEGYTSRQMTSQLSTSDVTIREIARAHGIEIPADRVTARTKHIVPERVVQETINTLNGIEYGLGLLSQADYDAFTSEQARAWLGALNTPARAIRVLLKELNERAREPR